MLFAMPFLGLWLLEPLLVPRRAFPIWRSTSCRQDRPDLDPVPLDRRHRPVRRRSEHLRRARFKQGASVSLCGCLSSSPWLSRSTARSLLQGATYGRWARRWSPRRRTSQPGSAGRRSRRRTSSAATSPNDATATVPVKSDIEVDRRRLKRPDLKGHRTVQAPRAAYESDKRVAGRLLLARRRRDAQAPPRRALRLYVKPSAQKGLSASEGVVAALRGGSGRTT